MPTIEFYGYSKERTYSLIETFKPCLADLPFCQDIVFVLRPSTVIGWNGLEQPFVRIASRSSERANIIRERLNTQTDVETVLIGFYPRSVSDDAPDEGQKMVAKPFETRLIEALQPIRAYTLSVCLYHFFKSGIFDFLMSQRSSNLQFLVDHFGMDNSRLEGLLKYLRNEDILEEQDGVFSLTDKGRGFSEFQAWYTMFIGGYGHTFLEIGNKLQRGSSWASRDLTQVGRGSCGISHYDAIPLTRTLIGRVPGSYHRLLDLGCGNGLYLVEFCKAFPDVEALGVEPGEGSYNEALELVRAHGLENRIHLVCSPALEYIHSDFAYQADFAVLGFVLHEILAQEGRNGVIDFLASLTNRFPDIRIVVIEVDLQNDNPAVMKNDLALAYYNPYYLLHSFTCQQLEKQDFWEQLFEQCQLEVLSKEKVNPEVDSTGLEIGYLLQRRR